MITFPYVQTNVFTDDQYSFSGNQLATFYDSNVNKTLTDDQMIALAREINFSETTFILPSKNPECAVKVRIFTPYQELQFAGHPVIGTSFILKNKNIIEEGMQSIQLELGIGSVTVSFDKNLNIIMTQPKPTFLTEFNEISQLTEALGLNKDDFMTEYPIQFVSTGNTFLMVPLKKLKSVQHITGNLSKLNELLKNFPSIYMYIFSLETIHESNDVHARMIAPLDTLFEDPATGSAAGPLIAYLEHYNLLPYLQRGNLIKIEQGYEIHRPSLITGRIIERNNSISGIEVGGKVKLTLDGYYFL